MYHIIKQQDMMETLKLITEFGDQFPMLTVKEINFYELAKYYGKDPKDFITMVVFLDCMRHMNEKSEKNIHYFINLEDVSKMKVKKNQHQWSFEIYKNAREKVKLQHDYHHVF